MNIKLYESLKLKELDVSKKLSLFHFWVKRAKNDPKMVLFAFSKKLSISLNFTGNNLK